MSNAILNAQASSAVCATIRESTLTNPFVYNEQGGLALGLALLGDVGALVMVILSIVNN